MSFLLDTNVLSELRKPAADRKVRAWFRDLTADLYTSVLVVGEIRRGVELKRRRDPAAAKVYDRWLEELLQSYAENILPVTPAIALRWGSLCLDQPVPVVDGLLAATALEHGLTLVTRNTRDLERTGAQVLNPFQ